MIQRISINTKAKVEFQDITRLIQDIVSSSHIQSGVCHVFVPHTTAGVTINEHADPSVVKDIAAQFDVLVPQHDNYRHLEGNSPAHIKATIVGSSETIIIDNGRLVLGTWQGIFFCEFDGPRNRDLLIKLVQDEN
jgi:secondary thiamine-phosphate synthase enzyme